MSFKSNVGPYSKGISRSRGLERYISVSGDSKGISRSRGLERYISLSETEQKRNGPYSSFFISCLKARFWGKMTAF